MPSRFSSAISRRGFRGNDHVQGKEVGKMKGYSPIHVLVEADLLYELDAYKSPERSRSQMVREAIGLYIKEMERTNQRKTRWIVQER